MRAMFILILIGCGPALAAKSAQEVTDHRKDCYFKGDGHYDRHGVSCAPPAKVVKKKEPPPQKVDDLKPKKATAK